MSACFVNDYLKVLKQISFDEYLFRKEFFKTLSWINRDDLPQVYVWLVENQFHEAYPDLTEQFKNTDKC
jgi:hypothetical protein